MFRRLRAAFQGLVAGRLGGPGLPTCPRCADKDHQIAELREQVIYWRTREERTADAYFASKGATSRIATSPVPRTENPMAMMARAVGVHEIDTTKSTAGQGALTGATDRNH